MLQYDNNEKGKRMKNQKLLTNQHKYDIIYKPNEEYDYSELWRF